MQSEAYPQQSAPHQLPFTGEIHSRHRGGVNASKRHALELRTSGFPVPGRLPAPGEYSR